MTHSCLFEGHVEHRRHAPLVHRFRNTLSLFYLDLAELDQLFKGRWLWSNERANLHCFLRRDYLGDPALPLDEAVRARVAAALGRRPLGPIRLLTQVRSLGWSFNPVSFYYCFGLDGQALDAVVAEITNTPWRERHSYVLDARAAAAGGEALLNFCFKKQFHVSPFLAMDYDYAWTLNTPGEQLLVHMRDLREGQLALDVSLSLRRRELDGWSLARVALRHPMQSLATSAAIYWQALRLRLAGAPFFPHPNLREQTR